MSQAFAVFPDHENRVLIVRGELDLATAPILEKHLQDAISNGETDLLVDISDCEFIDTAGIDVLLGSAERLAGNGGGQLTLVHPTAQARRVLDLVGLRYSSDSYGVNRGLVR